MSQRTIETDRRSTALAAEVPSGRPRLLFIDNIRWSMILLVLSMHAADTYSPFGNWYYTEKLPLTQGEIAFFATYQSFLQGFFMALLFFVAACFTPDSYDRKGAAGFIRDRFVRLGLPTLIYIFVIGPATEYYVSRSWTGGGGFARQWFGHITDGEWLAGTGPMWFCAALLAFSIAYALLRAAAERVFSFRHSRRKPSFPAIALFVVAMAAATFLVRTRVPGDASVLNMHPGDFPQYLLMFAAGLRAARGHWLERLSDRRAAITAIAALAPALPLWFALLAWGAGHGHNLSEFSGGWNWVSAGKCLWEALVCIGMSFALIALYRRWFDRQGRLARLLSDSAFAVYLVHPPILIATALLLRSFAAAAVLKAACLTLLAAVICFSFAALVLRRVPVLRRIL